MEETTYVDELFELLKFLLPSLVVLATAYFTIRSFMMNEQQKRMAEIRRESLKVTTPIRLQAYERVMLLLERMHPENLVLRVQRKGMSSKDLREALVKTIRAEFEHNLAQQIYVSGASWNLIKKAKEETIQLVNLSASKLPDNATGIQLSTVIIQMSGAVETFPTDTAIEHLRKEVQRIF